MEFNEIRFENENSIHIYKVEGKCDLQCVKRISDDVVLSIKFNDTCINSNFPILDGIHKKLIITINKLKFECHNLSRCLNSDLSSIEALYATIK